MGYRGVVGLEAFARGEGIEGSGRALDAFRTAFTP
jgi:hydroxypyruvate isomerase